MVKRFDPAYFDPAYFDTAEYSDVKVIVAAFGTMKSAGMAAAMKQPALAVQLKQTYMENAMKTPGMAATMKKPSAQFTHLGGYGYRE